MTTNRFNIVVIKGDGIGVDVTNAALEVLEAACRRGVVDRGGGAKRF